MASNYEPIPASVRKLVLGGILIAAVTLVAWFSMDIVHVQGSEEGVIETWDGGVLPQSYGPKTYVLNRLPFWQETMYVYNVASRVFVMNNKRSADGEVHAGRALDAYEVQSSEGQKLTISLNVRWHPAREKIVELHKSTRGAFEETLLRPAIMRIVKDEATRLSALTAYSGAGLVALQQSIQAHLVDESAEIFQRGIVVENFVIEDIKLDPNYVKEIEAKQIAVQATLRAQEEKKANDAKAEAAKAAAMIDLNTQVVAAERDKQTGILSAEKAKQVTILAAEGQRSQVELAAAAEKAKRVLEAEGEKEAGYLKGEAILAVGKAEAEAKRLQLSAYAAEGSEQLVRIEVARALASGMSNIHGYLPQDLQVHYLTGNFQAALDRLVGGAETKGVK